MLTATPTGGSTFAGWGGACSGAGSCDVVLNGTQTVTATTTIRGRARAKGSTSRPEAETVRTATRGAVFGLNPQCTGE